MPYFGTLLAPLVLLLPFPAVQDAARPGAIEEPAALTGSPQEKRTQAERIWIMTEGLDSVPLQYQVRIEQRLVIRVAPRGRVIRQSLAPDLPRLQQPRRLVERKMGKCVNMKSIVGVQPMRDNRLVLYLRGNRMIAAKLEKACTARDFYSGFYVEPSKDGKLCIGRDKLQSRTGVKCKLGRMRQLVPE